MVTRSGYILTADQEVWGDTLSYYRTEGHVIGYGNIQMDDFKQKMLAFGDYAEYWSDPGDALLTRNPSAISYDLSQSDSVFMRADTLEIYTISLLKEREEAERKAKEEELAAKKQAEEAAAQRRARIAESQAALTVAEKSEETSAPAVIVECAFVDNASDLKILATESQRKSMGEAIAKGILKTLGVAIQGERLYRVQVGAYLLKSNAEDMQKKIKAVGFDAFIVKE